MTRFVHLNCPYCDSEIEVEVVINEEADVPDTCPHCGEALPHSLYDKAQQEALEQLMDMADRRGDD